jgi:AcrR family transcriptional regulator
MPSKPDLYFDSVWMRPPRGRSGQPALGRAQIVSAAIELLDAEGLPGLSMRRLGTRLGSGATSIYWHVANKEELLELAVDEIMGELHVPDVGDTAWRVGVAMYATSMRMMLLRHSWMISQLGSKPTIGPNAMRAGDRMVALLTAAGLTGMELSHVSSMIGAHSIGSAATQAAVVAATRKAGVPVTRLIQEFEPYLEKVGPEHPHYDEWRRANNFTALDPERVWDEGFAFGIERMLDGLELWLAGRSTGPAASESATAGTASD